MLHTIISWDCSFRNCFHLIDALMVQDFSKNEFELIFVEQRTKEYANNYNHSLGFKSLEDRYNEVKKNINMRTIYLDHSEKIPYHLGLCNNEGIKQSQGEIISIMDGDQLLPPDFLSKLSCYHDKNHKAIINLYRKNCSYPVGVKTFENWMTADIDFKKCLSACPDKYVSVPKNINNYGPMISARKKYWEAIEGYDENSIWSTVLSKSGYDVNTRLEIVTGGTSVYIPKMFSVHPWHPMGGQILRKEIDAQRFLSIQELLINWSKVEQNPKTSSRMIFANSLLEQNREFIENILKVGAGIDVESHSRNNIKAEIIKCTINKAKRIILNR